MSAEYTITPLVVAYGLQREMSRFTYLNNYGQKIDIPYIAFLIQGAGRTILVDAGCSAEDYQQWIKPMTGGVLRLGGEAFKDVEDDTPIEHALQRHGLTVDDVDVLIQTHLDWDHCMNTLKFRKSRVVVQRSELEDLPVHPLYRNAHAPDAIYERYKALNLEVVDGDVKLMEGLELLFTPGHTAGGQSVMVNTRQGPYVIAGLCTIFANYYVPEETQQVLGHRVIPPGMHISATQAYDSVERILKLGGERILPLHEPSLAKLGTIG